MSSALRQQRGSPLWKYLGLRVCPAPAAPAPSGNLGFGPLGIEVKKYGFQTAWLRKVTVSVKKNNVGSSILTFCNIGSRICQIFMRVAR